MMKVVLLREIQKSEMIHNVALISITIAMVHERVNTERQGKQKNE